MSGIVSKKSAHPGMTYVKNEIFTATGFYLHHFTKGTGRWDSFPLKLRDFEKRLICGQEGGRGEDVIIPQLIEDICVGPDKIFGKLRLMPGKYFSGYMPSINQIASRADSNKNWAAEFTHYPEQLNLQGEQPLVLNIANKGELVLEAVGHDNILDLFLHKDEHWAITEGCAAFYDGSSGKWQKLVEPGFRFYWRATAAFDDGNSLYIGSDRGLVSRLDFAAGRFEILTAFQDRMIAHIGKNKAGEIIVVSKPSPLGMLPMHFDGKIKFLDYNTAKFDGKKWEKAEITEIPPADNQQWYFKTIEKRFRYDRSMGNFLFKQGEGEQKAKPIFYIKEVFFPKFLCASSDGCRLWISAFTGLMRIDTDKEEIKK
jgi:hypothetical protein